VTESFHDTFIKLTVDDITGSDEAGLPMGVGLVFNLNTMQSHFARLIFGGRSLWKSSIAAVIFLKEE